MGRTRARSLALGGAALAAAVLLSLRPVAVVTIENASRGTTFQAPVGRGEAFSVVYHHSMYDQPFTEEFVIEDGRILLVALSSPSAAVREYFGIDAAGERHESRRVLQEVVFRIAAGTAQRLRIGGVERSFLDLGEHGDRLVMRAGLRPALALWLLARGAAG